MCADAGLSIDQTANMLHVTPRTVRYWISGRVNIPYTAYRLIRILGRYELPDPAWRGWIMHSGKLWSPEGHGFVPADSSWWSRLCSQARYWRESYQREHLYAALLLRTGAAEAGQAERTASAEAGQTGDLAIGSTQLSTTAPSSSALPPCSNRGGRKQSGASTVALGDQLEPYPMTSELRRFA